MSFGTSTIPVFGLSLPIRMQNLFYTADRDIANINTVETPWKWRNTAMSLCNTVLDLHMIVEAIEQ